MENPLLSAIYSFGADVCQFLTDSVDFLLSIPCSNTPEDVPGYDPYTIDMIDIASTLIDEPQAVNFGLLRAVHTLRPAAATSPMDLARWREAKASSYTGAVGGSSLYRMATGRKVWTVDRADTHRLLSEVMAYVDKWEERQRHVARLSDMLHTRIQE